MHGGENIETKLSIVQQNCRRRMQPEQERSLDLEDLFLRDLPL